VAEIFRTITGAINAYANGSSETYGVTGKDIYSSMYEARVCIGNSSEMK
jgi:hypothetical protein